MRSRVGRPTGASGSTSSCTSQRQEFDQMPGARTGRPQRAQEGWPLTAEHPQFRPDGHDVE
ncbi:hypothetical protein GCM10009547_05380 [Sporichthya brevicatena]|uniref:Uncharacterized protein n=1 Tax=Sporichthya brevicatena TaxID=171442 RepID=A0ABN1G8R0_9ACTN